MNTTEPPLPDFSPTQRRLIAWRIGRGMPLAEAAAVEGIGADEAQTLLQDLTFLDQVESIRQMVEGSVLDRRRLLVEMARLMVEQGAADGDPEAAQVLRQFNRSRQGKTAPQAPASPAEQRAVHAEGPAEAAPTKTGSAVRSSDKPDAGTGSMALPAARAARVSTTPHRPAAQTMASLRNLFTLVRINGRAPVRFSPPTGTAPQHRPVQPRRPPAMPAC